MILIFLGLVGLVQGIRIRVAVLNGERNIDGSKFIADFKKLANQNQPEIIYDFVIFDLCYPEVFQMQLDTYKLNVEDRMAYQETCGETGLQTLERIKDDGNFDLVLAIYHDDLRYSNKITLGNGRKVDMLSPEELATWADDIKIPVLKWLQGWEVPAILESEFLVSPVFDIEPYEEEFFMELYRNGAETFLLVSRQPNNCSTIVNKFNDHAVWRGKKETILKKFRCYHFDSMCDDSRAEKGLEVCPQERINEFVNEAWPMSRQDGQNWDLEQKSTYRVLWLQDEPLGMDNYTKAIAEKEMTFYAVLRSHPTHNEYNYPIEHFAFQICAMPWNPIAHKGENIYDALSRPDGTKNVILSEAESSIKFFKLDPTKTYWESKDEVDELYNLYLTTYQDYIDSLPQERMKEKNFQLIGSTFKDYAQYWSMLYAMHSTIYKICPLDEERCCFDNKVLRSREMINRGLHMVFEASVFGKIISRQMGFNPDVDFPFVQFKYGNISYEDTVVFPYHQKTLDLAYPQPYWIDRDCYHTYDDLGTTRVGCHSCKHPEMCDLLSEICVNAVLYFVPVWLVFGFCVWLAQGGKLVHIMDESFVITFAVSSVICAACCTVVLLDYREHVTDENVSQGIIILLSTGNGIDGFLNLFFGAIATFHLFGCVGDSTYGYFGSIEEVMAPFWMVIDALNSFLCFWMCQFMGDVFMSEGSVLIIEIGLNALEAIVHALEMRREFFEWLDIICCCVPDDPDMDTDYKETRSCVRWIGVAIGMLGKEDIERLRSKCNKRIEACGAENLKELLKKLGINVIFAEDFEELGLNDVSVWPTLKESDLKKIGFGESEIQKWINHFSKYHSKEVTEEKEEKDVQKADEVQQELVTDEAIKFEEIQANNNVYQSQLDEVARMSKQVDTMIEEVDEIQN